MIRNSIPSHGRLRDGLYRSLRRTGSSWNMPAPLAIRILKQATCSRGDETARRSQRQHLHGEPKSKLKTRLPEFFELRGHRNVSESATDLSGRVVRRIGLKCRYHHALWNSRTRTGW